MKKLFSILSAISFILFALVDFCKNVLETNFHIQLMNSKGSFSSNDYFVDAGTQESFPTPQVKNINSSVLSFLYGPTLTSIHNYWKNRSFGYMDLCQQKY